LKLSEDLWARAPCSCGLVRKIASVLLAYAFDVSDRTLSS
jgi:hypothetical protein